MAASKKKTPEPKAALQSAKPAPEPPIAAPKPRDWLPALKASCVVLLAVFVLWMAWHFLTLAPSNAFVPGPGVNASAFQSAFLNASHVYVVMDTRGLNGTISDNVMQCGVDFAYSNGMGGKTVSYLSLSDSGCLEATIAGNGSVMKNSANQTVGGCISELDNGIVIYVESGANSYYYSNALVVGIGSNYTVGTCGIRRD
jgi:hypothetical protein